MTPHVTLKLRGFGDLNDASQTWLADQVQYLQREEASTRAQNLHFLRSQDLFLHLGIACLRQT